MESAEQRLRRLEARESIRECIQLYALAGDRRNDAATLRELFTKGAVYELVGMGRFEGVAAIVEGLTGIAQTTVLWSFHIAASPLIRLAEGLDRAQVFWTVWCPGRISGEEGASEPCWGAVQYNGEMVDEGGAWKFDRLLLETRMRTPFAGPWMEVEGPFHWPDWAREPRPQQR